MPVFNKLSIVMQRCQESLISSHLKYRGLDSEVEYLLAYTRPWVQFEALPTGDSKFLQGKEVVFIIKTMDMEGGTEY